jgi:hypothetical protein
MAKYISSELYKKYSTIIPTKFPRKSTPYELWDLVADNFKVEETEILVGLKDAYIKFQIKGKECKCVRPSNQILITNDDGDVIKELYELLVVDALEYILNNKFIKKQKKKKA